MSESELRAALRALADKMERRCGDHCSNFCWVCELRSDLRLILVRTAEPRITEEELHNAYLSGLAKRTEEP